MKKKRKVSDRMSEKEKTTSNEEKPKPVMGMNRKGELDFHVYHTWTRNSLSFNFIAGKNSIYKPTYFSPFPHPPPSPSWASNLQPTSNFFL